MHATSAFATRHEVALRHLCSAALSALLHGLFWIVAVHFYHIAWLPPSSMEVVMELELQEPSPSEPRAETPVETQAPSPVKEISPVKREGVDALGHEVTAEQIWLGGGVLKQGNEVRLTLRSLASMNFDEKDFVGTYDINGEPLTLTVRAWHNELVFEVPELGLRRALTRTSHFIYTYGPDFGAREPVEGSITFMPHGKTLTDTPSRMLWMPKVPPMKIGVMRNWRGSG